ncbi:hypothetical protein DMC30DRAFT_220694 [Rhodotorula diobovata]|uniref:Uncharacterized protein n=1 Tax=Rhodotorula diobovata TaxID=5288 RepID=A0A5C5FZB4_9BASI|nr:hypothetical protein DMC30DRAFT_220694 [Rhodotorula diobovata]
MPPSPPPDPPQPRQEHDPTLIQVDPDSVSLESLLQRLDAARASAMATINARADALVADDEVEEAPPLASHLDDLAADTLAQRHAARRQRELEWDERDTIDRRARALFSSLGPGRSVAPLYLPPTWTTGGAHDDHVMHDHEDDEDAITSLSYSDDGMDDGWAHSAAAAAGVGDDDGFHIAGFDGDVFGGDSDGESFDDEPWRAATTSAALAPRDDFLAMLPGFAGERPLNPPHVHVAPSAVYAAPSPVPRPTSHPSRGDPSSALSFSSFLRPGATFVGEQTFGSLAREARSRSRTRRAPVPVPVPAASSSGAAGNPRGTTAFDLAFERFSNEFAAEAAGRGEAAGDVSTAHPAFAPQSAEEGAPRTFGSLRNPPPPWRAGAALSWDGAFGPSSSLAIPRPAAASSSSSPPGGDPPVSGPSGSAGASGARSETSPLLALMLGRSSPSSRYAPYSATSSTAGTAGGSRPVHAPTATHPAPPVAPSSSAAPAASATSLSSSINASSSSSSDPAARARARVAQSVNPAARTSRSSWGEVGEELLLRAVARERERERERGEGRGVAKGRGGLEDERWGVKVRLPGRESLSGCRVEGTDWLFWLRTR